MVLGEGARIVVPGAVLGVAGGPAVGDFFGDLLFDVQPFEPAVVVVVSVGLAVLGTLAMMGPARCAARVDPTIALRAE